MTSLLKQAFDRASQLSQAEQDALARRILADLESERRWDTLFGESEEVLAELAHEALAEHRAGKTIPIDREDRRK